tara:strand:- start:8 stop:559 length:552 start_codon:yes stop_codon:yes gene_type:complete
LSWQDILKETIAQNRVKEIEDINIDIDEDDCLRWLNRLHDIIDREPLNESKEGESYRYLSDEEQACEIKRAWGNPFEKETGDAGYSDYSYSRRRLNKYFVTTKTEDLSKGAEVEFVVSNYDFYRYDDEEELFRISLWASPTNEGEGIASEFVTKDKEKAIKIVKKLCNYLNLSYNEMAKEILL